eukprot:TRINITY_DN868_c0_g1_i1.p2 TRINITY_DN868_c0_g1~~TRINITY_DN868_c0_g1_i1.p2  ORF type:complete len:110 (+),score=35.51 TRINITY_DN868_c0_g1_i1:96-425(+)
MCIRDRYQRRVHGDVLRGQRSGLLKKKIEKFQLDKKWKESNICKKMENQQKREKLNDFERFKVMILKKQMSRKIAGGMKTMRLQMKKKLEGKKKPDTKKAAKKDTKKKK